MVRCRPTSSTDTTLVDAPGFLHRLHELAVPPIVPFLAEYPPCGMARVSPDAAVPALVLTYGFRNEGREFGVRIFAWSLCLFAAVRL